MNLGYGQGNRKKRPYYIGRNGRTWQQIDAVYEGETGVKDEAKIVGLHYRTERLRESMLTDMVRVLGEKGWCGRTRSSVLTIFSFRYKSDKSLEMQN